MRGFSNDVHGATCAVFQEKLSFLFSSYEISLKKLVR